MHPITALEKQLAGPITDTIRTDLASRHKNGLSSLLEHRADLRGVYAFADVVEESVRWSA